MVWEARYKAFGEAEIITNEVENPLRFPGQYYDAETGLHQNFHRDYNPALGRYVEADPIGMWGGLNVYGYVYQDPISYFDSEGEFGLLGGAIGAAIEVGLQVLENYAKGCDIGNPDNYDLWDVGVAAGVGAFGPGWWGTGKTVARSARAIRTLSSQSANTPGRRAKMAERVSNHTNRMGDAIATQTGYQGGKMAGEKANGSSSCECNKQ